MAKTTRLRLTREQTRNLNNEFKTNPKVSEGRKKELADLLDMTKEDITTWFQERRKNQMQNLAGKELSDEIDSTSGSDDEANELDGSCTDTDTDESSSENEQEKNESKNSKNGVARRKRFPREKVLQLEKEYKINNIINTKRAKNLSVSFEMTEKEIKTWFHNRKRRLQRRQMQLETGTGPFGPRKQKITKKELMEKERNLMLPFRFKKHVATDKYSFADDVTMSKILNKKRYPDPEFRKEEFVVGVKTEDKKIFECKEPNCGAKFYNETSLKLHQNRHLKKELKCTFCGILFKNEEERTKHCKTFHPDLEKFPGANPLQCMKCKKISKDKTALYRHVRERHRDTKFPCPHCHYPFTSPDNLKVHVNTKHLQNGEKRKTFPCKLCGKVLVNKQSLRGHIRTLHRGKVEINCVLCNTKYTSGPSYKLHLKRHLNPKLYPCKICKLCKVEAQFPTPEHLRRHFTSHIHRKFKLKAIKQLGKEKIVAMEKTIEGISLLPPPGVKTRSNATIKLTQEELIEDCKKVDLKIILRRVDDYVVPEYKKNTANNDSSEEESGEDSEEESKVYLNCVYCDNSFDSLSLLKTHEKSCSSNKSLKTINICDVCNKEFDKPNELAHHKSISHSDERRFPCSYCNSKFKTNRMKMQHEKAVHFGIKSTAVLKRSRCNYNGCNRTFKGPDRLKEHVANVHLGIRHECNICKRTFSTGRTMRKHKEWIHRENVVLLLCRICKRSFRTSKALLSHYKSALHLRRTKELSRKFGGKQEMTDTLTGKLATTNINNGETVINQEAANKEYIAFYTV